MRISDGVQTCALPILGKAGESEAVPELSVEVLRGHRIATATAGMVHPGAEHTAVGLHHELGGRNRAPPLALDRRIDLRLDLAGERRHRRPPQRVVDEVFEADGAIGEGAGRSEEHTSELQSLMRISYAVFCLKKKTTII